MTKAQKQKALDQIALEISKCKICKKDKVGISVPGEGDPDANIVFLGEAPGKQEAETGKPFIGRAGKVLRSTLESIGIDPKDVFITSPVKYLPKHITPKLAEVEHGRVHLFQQLEVIKPKVIVLMGKTACLAMLNKVVAITKMNGSIIKQDGYTYFISLHPAAVLYSPGLREVFVKDFKKLKRLLKKL